MGGTALSILTPYTRDRAETVVVQELTAEGLIRYEPDPGTWYSPDGLPYGYDIQPPDTEFDASQVRIVERAAGTQLRCEILLHIFVGDVAGRARLARIGQRVADRTSGWVFAEFSDPSSTALLRHLGDAGRCIPVENAAFLDATATTAWIARPDFHIVK